MRASAVLVLLLAGLVIGCNKPTANPVTAPGASAGKTRITAVVTVGMVAELVRNVGGDHVEVIQLLGPGTDPHLYTPRVNHVKDMHSADMIFYSGLKLEGKLGSTLNELSASKPVIAVTEKIDPKFLLEPEDSPGHPDPHVWNDVLAWQACLTSVSDALEEFDPDHAEQYRAAAESYSKELDKLHAYAKETLSSIPTENRILVTSHDAFNYFGRAYDMQVMGVQGLSTESEAGLQRINELVDLLVEKKVKAVFVESSVPPKDIDALIDGAKSRDHQVIKGGELFSDAMGPSGTYTGTYIGMLDHNITTVARGLGGAVPKGGFNGQLDD